MRFIENVDEKEYRDFFNNYPDQSFMQSYDWGLFNKEARGLHPYFVGMKDDQDKLVAIALLNERKTPLNMSYIYSPRGFCIDYNNKELLKVWTEEIRKFIKKRNAIYLKIDPEIMYQEIDENGHKLEGGKNNYDIFNNLVDLAYKHQGFNKLFEKNQPRYTYRIPLDKPFGEVEKNIHKTFMRTIKRSYFYDLEIILNNDIDTFYDLLQNISNRDDFEEYDKSYYQKQFDLFSKNDNIKIHSAKIYPDKVIKKLEEELNSINETDSEATRIERLKKDLEFFKPFEHKYPEGKIIASVISIYTTHGAWALYIGNDNIAQYTFTVNRLYYEFTKYAHERGCKFIDLFGTVGDPNTTYKNLAGIHEYKRKFGGDYIEFLGEFDIVNKPFWYFLLPKLLWVYRKIKKILKK